MEYKIVNLVTAAEIESGNLEVSYSSVNIQTLLDEVLESFKYIAEEKHLTLASYTHIDHNIAIDSRFVYIILKNLIANACRFCDEDTEVAVGAEVKENKLLLCVQNRGEAPKVEHKAEIFRRFASAPEGHKGFGIGLSIVNELTLMLDGEVDYKVDDSFVEFTVTLSLSEEGVSSDACGSNEFLFESFENAIEL